MYVWNHNNVCNQQQTQNYSFARLFMIPVEQLNYIRATSVHTELYSISKQYSTVECQLFIFICAVTHPILQVQVQVPVITYNE